jgi:hypothetical protein
MTEEEIRRAIQDTWSKGQAATDPRIIREYRRVVLDLRVELLEFLTTPKATPSRLSSPLDPWLLDPLTPLTEPTLSTKAPTLRSIQGFLKKSRIRGLCTDATGALLRRFLRWSPQGTGSLVAATDGHLLVQVTLPKVAPHPAGAVLVGLGGRAASRKPITTKNLSARVVEEEDWSFPAYDDLWVKNYACEIELPVAALLHMAESEGPAKAAGRWRERTFHFTKGAIGLHGAYSGAFRQVKDYKGPDLVFDNHLWLTALGLLDLTGSVTVGAPTTTLTPLELRQQTKDGIETRMMVAPMRVPSISHFPPVIPTADFQLPPVGECEKGMESYPPVGRIVSTNKRHDRWAARIGRKAVTGVQIGGAGNKTEIGTKEEAREALRRAAWLVTKGRL